MKSLEVLLRNLRDQHGSEDGTCPTPGRLVNMSRIQLSSPDEYRNLASHLLHCFKCAQRWEQLQHDPHLDVLELMTNYAQRFPDNEAGRFLELRTNLHLRGCTTCQAKREMVGKGVSAAKSLESVGQSLTDWLSPRLVMVGHAHRAAESQAGISASVTDEYDKPILNEAGNIRVESVDISMMKLSQSGLLSIGVNAVPAQYREARLMLFDTQGLVVFPWCEVISGEALFELETSLSAAGIELDHENITIWLRRGQASE